MRLVDVRRDLQRVIDDSGGILCEVDGLDEKLRSGKTVLGLEYTLRNADGTVPRLPGNCSLRIWIFGHKTLPWDKSPVRSLGIAMGKGQDERMVEEACRQAFGVGLKALSQELESFDSREPTKCQVQCMASERPVEFVELLLDLWRASPGGKARPKRPARKDTPRKARYAGPHYRSKGAYACPRCGAGYAGALSVPAAGDLQCTYCGTWFHVGLTSGS